MNDRLQELREKWKTANPTMRQIIERQVKALKISEEEHKISQNKLI